MSSQHLRRLALQAIAAGCFLLPLAAQQSRVAIIRACRRRTRAGMFYVASLLALCTLAHASTWTANFKANTGCTASANCAITTLSPAVGAGNLLIVVAWLAQADDAITISSITGDACTLVQGPGVAGSSVEGGIRTAYCLSAVGTETSITINLSSAPANAWRAQVNYASSTAPPFFFDAKNSNDQTTVVTPQPGVALAVKGANDILYQWIRLGGGSITSISGAYSLQTNTSITASAVALNSTVGTAPSWTLASGQKAAVVGLAFGDATGGGTRTGGPTKRGGPTKVQ